MKAKVFLLLGALILPAVSACSSGTASCEKFLDAPSAEQLQMASGWISDNSRELTAYVMFNRKSESEKAEYAAETLSEYCAENPDASLGDLGPGIGFGS